MISLKDYLRYIFKIYLYLVFLNLYELITKYICQYLRNQSIPQFKSPLFWEILILIIIYISINYFINYNNPLLSLFY